MRCPTCQSDQPDDARFCAHCGTALAARCPACATEATPGQRFCAHCGSPLAAPEAPAPAPERKRVTILFADLVGSTALAEGMDAEEVHDLYNQCLQRMSEAVTRMGGTVGALMGDGMMAFFGAPLAHEDDPERAALAALAIIEAIQQYGAATGRALQVRVGLNTGRVMMAPLGGVGRTVYTAVGEAVNLAARLEGAAVPDTVLASAATWQAIAPRFEGEPVGPIAVKGKREPLHVVRILRPKSQPENSRGLAGMRAPLIGRTVEQAALDRRVRALADGAAHSGGVALIVGEAGIGKSRLTSELMRAAQSEGVACLEGRSLSYTQVQPYWPWLGLMRQWLGLEEGEGDEMLPTHLREALYGLWGEEAATWHPFLASLFSLPLPPDVGAQLTQMTAEARHLRVRAALRRWVEALAAQGPLVLVFEDLHWADPSSLALIEHVATASPALPLLLLGVSRPDEADEVLALRDRLAAQLGARFSEHRLQPLSDESCRTLVASLLESEPPDGLLPLVLARADGNPFFVEELLRTLLDEGTLHRSAAGWQLTPEATSRLPRTVEALLSTRIDRLDRERKELLQRASVVGRVFWRRLLAAMIQQGQRLDESLFQLGRMGLIRQRGWRELWETEYIFRHALTQEAAYESIPHTRRRSYHREVAQAMEALLPATSREFLGVLATHWEEAGDVAMARDYLERAGDDAAARFANVEALHLYSRALALIAPEERASRYELLEKRQQLFDRLGQREPRHQDLDEMLRLADALADPARLARARAHRYLFAVHSGEGASLPPGLDERLIAALEEHQELPLLLDLLELLAIRYWWGFSFPLDQARGRALQQHACAVAARVSDEPRRLLNEALLAELEGTNTRAIAALNDAHALAEARGNQRQAWLIHHRLGRLLRHSDSAQALHHHRRSSQIAQQMSDSRLELIAADNLGESAFAIGDYPSAWEAWSRALALQQQREQSPAEQLSIQARHALLLARSGRLQEASDRALAVAQQAQTLGATHDALELLLLAAEIALLHGNQRQAEALVAQAAALPEPSDAHRAWLRSLLLDHIRALDLRLRGAASEALTVAETLRGTLSELAILPQFYSYNLPTLTATQGLHAAVDQGDPATIRRWLALAGEPTISQPLYEWPLPDLLLARHRAHHALGETAAAGQLLAAGQALLLRHAAFFHDAAWRSAFVDALPSHRLLLAAERR